MNNAVTPSRLSRHGQAFAFAVLAWLANPASGWAAPQTVGQLMAQANAQFSSGEVFSLFSYICYVVGTVFGLQALLAAARHGTNQGKSLTAMFVRAMGSAAFYNFPRAVGVLREVLFKTSTVDNTFNNTFGKTSSATEGLDHSLVHMITDITPALTALIGLIAFLSGIFMIFSGLLALSNQGFQQETANKTQIMARLGVGTALTAFASSVETILGTIFGQTTLNADSTLAYSQSALDAATNQAVSGVLNAIFIWLTLIGLISILRGLWILKAALEKGHSGLTAPLTHLIAGGMLCNMGPTVQLIQKTLDVPGIT